MSIEIVKGQYDGETCMILGPWARWVAVNGHLSVHLSPAQAMQVAAAILEWVRLHHLPFPQDQIALDAPKGAVREAALGGPYPFGGEGVPHDE